MACKSPEVSFFLRSEMSKKKFTKFEVIYENAPQSRILRTYVLVDFFSSWIKTPLSLSQKILFLLLLLLVLINKYKHKTYR